MKNKTILTITLGEKIEKDQFRFYLDIQTEDNTLTNNELLELQQFIESDHINKYLNYTVNHALHSKKL